jgi:hypothetical protein
MKSWLKRILLTAITLVTPAAPTQADIMQIDTVDGLISYMNNVNDQSTLTIFDVDMVLLMPMDSFFRMPTLKKYHTLYKSMTKPLTKPQKDIVLMYMLLDSPLMPLDNKMIGLIQTLQSKGVPTIAFTASLTGSIDRVANMVAWRLFSLETAGYHMANGFPYVSSVTFDRFPRFAGSYPMFNQGVLFANGGHHGPASKGKVLVQFLNYVYKGSLQGVSVPRRIIMVDDNKKNLVDIETNLRQAFPQTTFTGIHFTAADHVPVNAVSESEFKNKLTDIITQARLNQVH